MFAAFFVIAAALAIAGVVIDNSPDRDVALRYAPMCEAFASGNWRYAFHPRIQPLPIVAGGIIARIFQCDGFMASKIASLLWFFAGGVVIWKLFRELYSEKPWIANAATTFYAFFSYNIRLAYSGLRESCKIFVLLLIAWALIKVYKNTKGISGYILLGAGCALAVLCRADMIMLGIFLLFTGMVLEAENRKIPLNSLVPIVLTGGCLLLNTYLNYRIFNWAVPDCRGINICEKLLNRLPQMSDMLWLSAAIFTAMIPGAMLAAWILREIAAGYFLAAAAVFTIGLSVYRGMSDSAENVTEFIKALTKGFYHAVGIFTLLTVIYLICRKRFTKGEFILCLIILGNAFFCIVPMLLFDGKLYVSERYLYAAVPLMAGFFVIGINEIYQFLRERYNVTLANAALILSCTAISAGFLFHAAQPLLAKYTRKKIIREHRAIAEIIGIIRNDYRGARHRERDMIFDLYCSNKAPLVFWGDNSKLSVAAYLAGGSITFRLNTTPDFYVGQSLPGRFRKRARFLKKVVCGKKSYLIWRIKQ